MNGNLLKAALSITSKKRVPGGSLDHSYVQGWIQGALAPTPVGKGEKGPAFWVKILGFYGKTPYLDDGNVDKVPLGVLKSGAIGTEMWPKLPLCPVEGHI